MAETWETDAVLSAKSGTTAGSGIYYPTQNEDPWFVPAMKQITRIEDVAGLSGQLRIFKDGDLTFGAKPGRFLNGESGVNYAGATAQALTDDDTNYIYLDAAGALTVNITGFPTPSVTPHIPLATIAVGSESDAGISGEYNREDITDYRGHSAFTPTGSTEVETVEASTAGVGAPNVLTATESGKTLTNEGSTAKNYHTLPTAAAGLTFCFIVQDDDGLRVTAAAADTIRINDAVSIAAGYAESTDIGSVLTLLAINATEWIATAALGTWDLEIT